MKFFYLSSLPTENSRFEIHERNCVYKPPMLDLIYLGPFNSGQEALRAALLKNNKAVTCTTCCQSTFSPSFVSRSNRNSQVSFSDSPE